MKHINKKWAIRVGALGLALAGLTGAALAAGGDKNDPLITLSYLNETAIPQVEDRVEESTRERVKALEKSFADQIDRYRQEASQSGPSGGEGSASFTLVTMTSGQTMKLDVGCELLLRVGSATVSSNTNPALIDLSTGGTVNNGASLTKNHLYMATIPDRTLSANAADVKLLVRGGYSIE